MARPPVQDGPHGRGHIFATNDDGGDVHCDGHEVNVPVDHVDAQGHEVLTALAPTQPRHRSGLGPGRGGGGGLASQP